MDDEHTYIPSPRQAQAPPAHPAPVRPAPASPAPVSPAPAHRPGSDGEHQIQRHLETTDRADRFYNDQMLDHLNERMREFVGLQEMFFLATADRNGECDSTFRAGPPGFLRVLDERTLVFPEYRGNGVHASLGNIQENPHLGIMIIDFLRARIGLHINGEAEIIADADIRAQHPDLPTESVPGRKARLWVKVTVEEAYIHCAKHIPHLQRAPKGTARDWGTDDYRRKGGDFFGVARDRKATRETHTSSPSAEPVPASATATPPPARPAPLSASAPEGMAAPPAEQAGFLDATTPPPPQQRPHIPHIPHQQPARQPHAATTTTTAALTPPSPPSTPPVPPAPPAPATAVPPAPPGPPAQPSAPPLPARPPGPPTPAEQPPTPTESPEASASTAELPQPAPDWRSEALRVLAEAEARGRAGELESVSAHSEASGTSFDTRPGESAGAPTVHSWFGGRI